MVILADASHYSNVDLCGGYKSQKDLAVLLLKTTTTTNNNNNNKHDNVYGAVIMAEPLREFTRFL